MHTIENEMRDARQHVAQLESYVGATSEDVSHVLQSLAQAAERPAMANFLKEIGAAEVLDRLTQIGNAGERVQAERGLIALGVESTERRDAREQLRMNEYHGK